MGFLFNPDIDLDPSHPMYIYYWQAAAWMYDVMYAKIRTINGKRIVREHMEDYDVLQIMNELKADASSSTAGRLMLRTKLREIINMRLTSSYNKSITEFLTDLQNKIISYNQQQPVLSAKIGDDNIRQYIECAVAPCKPLRDVGIREMERIIEGVSEGYNIEQYIGMLYSAAAIIDESRTERINRRASLHEINKHYFDHVDDGPTETSLQVRKTDVEMNTTDSDDDGDVIKEFLAFKASMKTKHPTGSRMDRDTWRSLNKDTQKVWDTISDKDKAKILTFATKKPEKTKTVDFNIHELGEEGSDATNDEVGASELQVNVTDTISDAKSEAHPGDPRAMMSTHKSKKPSGKESTAKKVSISCNEMWFGNGNDVGISEDVDDSDDSVDLGECARYWGDVYPRDQDFR